MPYLKRAPVTVLLWMMSLVIQAGSVRAQSCSGDINSDGEVNGADLAILLAQWGPCPQPDATTFFGTVVMPNGSPATGAELAGDLGGNGTSDKAGQFTFEVQLDHHVNTFDITATIEVNGIGFSGLARVSPVQISQPNDAGTIVLKTACDSALGWSDEAFSGGLNGTVYDFEVFDDGTGAALYVAGAFTMAGGLAANGVAKWNGSQWSALGSGIPGGAGNLEVFDYGTGPTLYAMSNGKIYRWSGAQWVIVAGLPQAQTSAMGTHDFGSGQRLYYYTQWDLLEWDGSTTRVVPGSPSQALCFASASDPFGDALFVGTYNGMHRWDGYGWNNITCFGGSITSIAVWEPGPDSPFTIYACGSVSTCNSGQPSVASWSGFAWSALGGGVGGAVNALGTFTGGSTRSLIVGGDFTSVEGVPGINRIARWQNGEWHSMGIGLNATPRAIIEFDDGAGPAIYVGGDFTVVNGQPRGRIAKWGCLSE